MGKKQKGYILLHRAIDDSEIATKPPHFREVWLWLLRKAEPFDCTRKGRRVKRSQLLLPEKYKDIINGLKWKCGGRTGKYSKSNIDNVFRYLRRTLMVTTQNTTAGLMVTILNYDKYQASVNPEHDGGHDHGHDSLSLYREQIINKYVGIDVPKNFPLEKLVDYEIARMKGKKDGRTKWDDKARRSAIKQLLSLKEYGEELKRRGLFSIGDVLDLAIEGKWRGFTQYKKGLKGDRVKREQYLSQKSKNETATPQPKTVTKEDMIRELEED